MTAPLRYSSVQLDLSRLPKPDAIKDLSYETILAARKAHLLGLFDAADVPYDVEMLETDPAIILQEEDAYRELLDLAAINDAVRAVMVAFAQGSDLDHLAAFYNITRLEGELDERLRYRVLLAPEAWGLGKLAGYLQATLTASADIIAAGVYVDRSDPYQPVIRIAPQSATGVDGVPSNETLDDIRVFLNREDVKGATDVVQVSAPKIIPYSIDVTIEHLPGPDPALVRANALAGLQKFAAERFRPGRDIPRSWIDARASVEGVERVRIHQPPADIAVDLGALAACRDIRVQTEIVDG